MAAALTPPGPYVAPFGATNPHLQTIYGSLLAPRPPIHYRRERWDTPDGDFVDMDCIDGPAEAPWLHLFHGLEGSSHSPYARHLMHQVQRLGWRGSVLNFRGCSGEPNRLARAYHSGDSAEVDWVLRRLRPRTASAPLYVAGVSLGGNAFLKWLGERRAEALPIVDRAAAISAPVDLMAAGWALERGFSAFYGRHFLQSLRRTALAKLARFPGLFDEARVRAARTLREFDDAMTAPVHGFAGVDDYYTRSSAKPLLAFVQVPTLLLNARDDPFLPSQYLPNPDDVAPAVRLEFPPHGGHVGFVRGWPGRIDWLPRRLIHFFRNAE